MVFLNLLIKETQYMEIENTEGKREIWYKDIDPDTGNISNESRLCVCESDLIANWVMLALLKDMSLDYDNPNRELFFK